MGSKQLAAIRTGSQKQSVKVQSIVSPGPCACSCIFFSFEEQNDGFEVLLLVSSHRVCKQQLCQNNSRFPSNFRILLLPLQRGVGVVEMKLSKINPICLSGLVECISGFAHGDQEFL